MARIIGFIPLSAAAFALLGCQQESANPADSAAPAGDREYALEAQRLKAGPEEFKDAGLAALDAKFGYPATQTVTAPPARETTAMEKAAATKLLSLVGNCSRISKFIFKMAPGDRVIFRATSLNEPGVGSSDPVALLIQFDNTAFINNGTLPNTALTAFNILAWNDDVASGNLSAGIDHTFQPGQSGHFMVMAIPYNNGHSTRSVDLSMDLFQASCPNCDYIIMNPRRKLGGLVYSIVPGATDFRANRMTLSGNPHLYVILNTLGFGMSSGNTTPLDPSSRIAHYPVASNQGSGLGNVVFVDNDESGTASFLHTQYTP